MQYPINYPFAKLFQRLGFTLIVRIDVIFDVEANVYVATSKDISGLILEAETFKTLELEVQEAVVNLTQFSKNTQADLIYRDHIVLAQFEMEGYEKLVKKILAEHGWLFLRSAKGSHEYWGKEGYKPVIIPHGCKRAILLMAL